ncbi:MAG TPA: GlsB/YeaQ/YmgE family stress response membrane protein [Thermoguttaceae bacterium]|nr:GlsB/YeaQ/YmgE family stress response membrane protein [Thermoguttaceae bacterium]
MHPTMGELIVWLIVGALVGNLVGWMVTLKREGLGRWINLAVGMGGALVGGFLFNVLGIDLGLGDLKVTFEDLISATAGSLLLIAVWRIVRWRRNRKIAE